MIDLQIYFFPFPLFTVYYFLMIKSNLVNKVYRYISRLTFDITQTQINPK